MLVDRSLSKTIFIRSFIQQLMETSTMSLSQTIGRVQGIVREPERSRTPQEDRQKVNKSGSGGSRD